MSERQFLRSYDDFVRKEVLPKARSDFRLPPDIYAIRLSTYGADYTAAELERLAHKSFTEIQAQMQELAVKVAKERGISKSEAYRELQRSK